MSQGKHFEMIYAETQKARHPLTLPLQSRALTLENRSSGGILTVTIPSYA